MTQKQEFWWTAIIEFIQTSQIRISPIWRKTTQLRSISWSAKLTTPLLFPYHRLTSSSHREKLLITRCKSKNGMHTLLEQQDILLRRTNFHRRQEAAKDSEGKRRSAGAVYCWPSSNRCGKTFTRQTVLITIRITPNSDLWKFADLSWLDSPSWDSNLILHSKIEFESSELPRSFTKTTSSLAALIRLNPLS